MKNKDTIKNIELIKRILELAESLKDAEGMGALVDINEMELLVDKYKYDSISTRVQWFNERLQKMESDGWVLCSDPLPYQMDLQDYLQASIKKAIQTTKTN